MPDRDSASIDLPWRAAAAATVATVLLTLIRFVVMIAANVLGTGTSATLNPLYQLPELVDQVVLVGGVAFALAQWHSDRSRIYAYRRTWLMLSLFTLIYLMFSLLVSFGLRALTHSMGLSTAWVFGLLRVLEMACDGIGLALAWLLAVRAFRSGALTVASPAAINRRARIAGLSAWFMLLLMSATAMLWGDVYGMIAFDEFAQGLLLRAGLLALAGLLMLGSWLGLPRMLLALHGRRLLGMSLASYVSVLLLLSLVGVGALIVILTSSTNGLALLVALGFALLVGPVGFGWLWSRLFYRRYRLGAG